MPNNYNFQVRGFSLNYLVSRTINFDTQKRLIHKFVEEGVQERVNVSEQMIRRRADRQVVTKTVQKNYGVVFVKRRVLPDFNTLPYGY